MRDNNPKIPYPNTWTLFGGSIKENETPIQVLQRELKEELGIKLVNPKKLLVRTRIQDGQEREDNIFLVGLNQNVAELKLREGQEMKLFSIEDLEKINIFLPFKEYIIDYFSK